MPGKMQEADKKTTTQHKIRPRRVQPARDDKTPKETGGPKGPEPTRYGDWERNGRCVDF